MENSLISGLRLAIKNCGIIESDMIAERDRILPELEGAHYLNGSTIHLIERQYNEKIENTQDEIDGMKAHLRRLEAEPARKDDASEAQG